MSDWLEKPAIQWSSVQDSSYWDELLLSKLCADETSFMTYKTLINLAVSLIDRLKLPIHQKCGIPIVVAIPEGPLLPIAILLVHVLNRPDIANVVLVPMEPSEGKERLKHMIEDVRPFLILCLPGKDWTNMEEVLLAADCGDMDEVADGLLRTSGPQLLDFKQLVLDTLEDMQDDTHHKSDNLGVWDLLGCSTNGKARVSHIVYTSGTTGRSKGCISSHAALRHYLVVKNEAHCITSSSVVLLASALSFDPCLSDILATLQAKATLAIAPRKALLQNLAGVLGELHVTHILCTPTLWSMVQPQASLPELQVVALGGEPIPKRVVTAWSCRVQLCATYGVTEACVYQTMARIHGEEGSVKGQCVGKAFRGLQFSIVAENDSLLVPLKEGDVGEVVLSGTQIDLLSGYLNRENLTATKFVKRNEIHYYRTGDRGCISGGCLYIQGRIQGEEGMVKVKGVRVELGEIEAALVDEIQLEDDPLVVLACLAVVENVDPTDDTSPNQIHAYCVLSNQCNQELCIHWNPNVRGVLITRGPLLTLLRMRCSSYVRAGVMPSVFVAIPEIPLTPTGKTDRRQLPQLSECVTFDDVNGSQSQVLLKDYGISGAMVSDIIVDFLNLQPCQQSMLTTEANFAMLGGDSLAATRVVRTLFANHEGVPNSRHLGGAYGSLEGTFAVSHLLCSRCLGEYVDWLDSNSVFGPHFQTEEEAAKPSEARQDKSYESTDADLSQYESLVEATSTGQTSLVVGLLNAGVDPNCGNHGGRLGKTSGRNERKQKFTSNPLHVACSKGNPTMVRALLRKGCKFNSPDASGSFPLHMAAASTLDSTDRACEDDDRARSDCVALLLHAGAPITMRDGNKQTVLHAAARAGHCQMLRFLIGHWKRGLETGEVPYKPFKHKGGKLNWQDRWFRTPVHWAVLNGRVDALQILLENEFDPDPPQPSFKNSKKYTSVKIERPVEICDRLFIESDERWVRIRKLLIDALST